MHALALTLMEVPPMDTLLILAIAALAIAILANLAFASGIESRDGFASDRPVLS